MSSRKGRIFYIFYIKMRDRETGKGHTFKVRATSYLRATYSLTKRLCLDEDNGYDDFAIYKMQKAWAVSADVRRTKERDQLIKTRQKLAAIKVYDGVEFLHTKWEEYKENNPSKSTLINTLPGEE